MLPWGPPSGPRGGIPSPSVTAGCPVAPAFPWPGSHGMLSGVRWVLMPLSPAPASQIPRPGQAALA